MQNMGVVMLLTQIYMPTQIGNQFGTRVRPVVIHYGRTIFKAYKKTDKK